MRLIAPTVLQLAIALSLLTHYSTLADMLSPANVLLIHETMSPPMCFTSPTSFLSPPMHSSTYCAWSFYLPSKSLTRSLYRWLTRYFQASQEIRTNVPTLRIRCDSTSFWRFFPHQMFDEGYLSARLLYMSAWNQYNQNKDLSCISRTRPTCWNPLSTPIDYSIRTTEPRHADKKSTWRLMLASCIVPRSSKRRCKVWSRPRHIIIKACVGSPSGLASNGRDIKHIHWPQSYNYIVSCLEIFRN